MLARTDARVSRGFDEALARIREFVAAGADILFLDSPQSEEEMRTSIEACKGNPTLAVASPAGKHFMPGAAELERIGIYPQDILAASVRAMRRSRSEPTPESLSLPQSESGDAHLYRGRTGPARPPTSNSTAISS